MGYDIDIQDPETGETLQTAEKHDIKGSTYCIGGTHDLHIAITYNYGKFYYREDTLGESTVEYRDTGKGYLETVKPERGGIPGLAYCTIEEARSRVARAIANLKGERSNNYWDPTEGNARAALINLLCLLEYAPLNAKIAIS